MTRAYLFELIAALGILLASSIQLDGAETLFWRDLCSIKDVRQINSRVHDARGIRWPKVHSSKRQRDFTSATELEKPDFAKLTQCLVSIIEEFSLRLQQTGEKEVVAGVTELLVTRDWIAESPSYQNFILIDSINRHSLLRLLELLKGESPNVSEITKGLLALRRYQLDSAEWGAMLQEETGRHSEDNAERGSSEPAQAAERLRRIQRVHFPSKEIWTLHSPSDYKTVKLLSDQDFAPLAMRMIGTDYYINSVVPALIEYLTKADSPNSSDSYERIRDVLGKDTLVPDSIGARFTERRRASAAVEELFHEINTGTIRKLVKLIQ